MTRAPTRAPVRAGLAVLATAALAAGTPATGGAQKRAAAPRQMTAPPARTPPEVSGAELTVYVVTVGQGDVVWERFGHNAIWIRDARRGTDVAYNWGMFDFHQPNFLGRFLTGDTKYWMAGLDASDMLGFYIRANRSVWMQELALTPTQRAALRDFVEWNARPENMYYRYDYYRDNCSTRVRDALDRALGGRLRAATAGRMTPTTYRFHSLRLTAGDWPVYTGIDLALGERADLPISEWEEMFLPVRMMAYLREVRVPDDSGRAVPLVKSERQLFAATRPAERSAPPVLFPAYLALGAALGGLVMLLGRATAAERWCARAALTAVGVAWCVVVGVLGAAGVLAWTATRHVITQHNENLLQVTPLALGLAVLLPVAARPGSRAVAARAARVLAVALAALATLGLLLKALPPFYQRNGEMIALFLPVHLALAWALWRVGRAQPVEYTVLAGVEARDASHAERA